MAFQVEISPSALNDAEAAFLWIVKDSQSEAYPLRKSRYNAYQGSEPKVGYTASRPYKRPKI